MADSISLYFPLTTYTTQQEVRAWNMPFKYGDHGTQEHVFRTADGRQPRRGPRRYSEWMTVESPTGAQYRVRARLRAGTLDQIDGYEVDCNVPACVKGNNVIVQTSVSRSVELAHVLLQHFILPRTDHPAAADAIDLERAQILSPTLTDCHDLGTPDAADRALAGFGAAGQMVNDVHGVHRHGKEARAHYFAVGAEHKTHYRKHRSMDQAAYIKRPTPKSTYEFENQADAAMMERRALQVLRHESTLKPSFVEREGLHTLESWRRYGSETVYQRFARLAMVHLCLDEELRARKPKPEHLAGLSEPDLGIVQMHVRGEDWHQHPEILARVDKLARQQYESAIKQRVLERVKINLDVRWDNQVAAATSCIRDTLRARNLCQPTAEEELHSFTSATTMEILRRLRLDLAQRQLRMARARRLKGYKPSRLDAVDAGPDEWDLRVIDMTRLTVDRERVFPALRKAGRPLHPILTAYSKHCWGDIPLEECDANREAVERAEPLRGVYTVGDNQIVVTTAYLPDAHGEVLPWVTVTAERLPLA